LGQERGTNQTGPCLKDILDLVQVALIQRVERILAGREGALNSCPASLPNRM
jgi:hypothetical protein